MFVIPWVGWIRWAELIVYLLVGSTGTCSHKPLRRPRQVGVSGFRYYFLISFLSSNKEVYWRRWTYSDW